MAPVAPPPGMQHLTPVQRPPVGKAGRAAPRVQVGGPESLAAANAKIKAQKDAVTAARAAVAAKRLAAAQGKVDNMLAPAFQDAAGTQYTAAGVPVEEAVAAVQAMVDNVEVRRSVGWPHSPYLRSHTRVHTCTGGVH